MKKRQIFAAFGALIMIGLIIIMVADLFPLVKEVISDADDESNMVDYIRSYGAKGVPILMGLQALQIIVAIIPSAAIQLLTGLCYGVWWGTLINIAGSVLGNIIVFTVLRQMDSFLTPFFKHGDSQKGFLSVANLSQMKNPERIAFFLFLIPAIPNGIVPYVFARSNVPISKYIPAVVLGSVPSTFICTFLGERVSKGNYSTAVIVALAVLIIALCAFLFKNKIMSKISAKNL